MVTKVIKVPEKLLPCVESTFDGTQCIVTLLNIYKVIDDAMS